MTTLVDQFSSECWHDENSQHQERYSDFCENDFKSSCRKFNSRQCRQNNQEFSKPNSNSKAPIFISSLKDCYVNRGAEVLLEIIVDGIPPPTVIWYKDGIRIKENDIENEGNRYRVYIVDADDSDKGVYSVTAKNEYGEAKCYARLFLKKSCCFESDAPVFIRHFNDIRASSGENAMFEAIIEGNPKPSVRWLFNDKPIRNSRYHYSNVDNCYRLVVSNANIHDNGELTLIAENENGKISCSARLYIEDNYSYNQKTSTNYIPTRQRTNDFISGYKQKRSTSARQGKEFQHNMTQSQFSDKHHLGFAIRSGSYDSTHNQKMSDEFSLSSEENYRQIHEYTRDVTEKRYQHRTLVSEDDEIWDAIQKYKPVELIVGKKHKRSDLTSDHQNISQRKRRKRQIRLSSVPIGEHSKRVIESSDYKSYQPVDIILNKPKIRKEYLHTQREDDSVRETTIQREDFVNISVPKIKHSATIVKKPKRQTDISRFQVKGEHETKHLDELIDIQDEFQLKIPKTANVKVIKQRKRPDILHKITKQAVISGDEHIKICQEPLEIREEVSVNLKRSHGKHSSTIVREKELEQYIDIDTGKIAGKHDVKIIEDQIDNHDETNVKIPKPSTLAGQHSSTVMKKVSKARSVDIDFIKTVPGEKSNLIYDKVIESKQSVDVKLPKTFSQHSATVIQHQNKSDNVYDFELSRSIPGDSQHLHLTMEARETELKVPKKTSHHSSTVVRERAGKHDIGRTRTLSGEHIYKLFEDVKDEYSSTVVLKGKDEARKYDINLTSDFSEVEEDVLDTLENRQGHMVSWLSDVSRETSRERRHLTTVVKKQDDKETIEMILSRPLNTNEIIADVGDYSAVQPIYIRGPNEIVEREIIHKDVKSEIKANFETNYCVSTDLIHPDQKSTLTIENDEGREEIVDFQMSNSTSEVIAHVKPQFSVSQPITQQSSLIMEVDKDNKPSVELSVPMPTIEPSRSVICAQVPNIYQVPKEINYQDGSSSELKLLASQNQHRQYNIKINRPEVEQSSSAVVARVGAKLVTKTDITPMVRQEPSSSSVNIDLNQVKDMNVNLSGLTIDSSCSQVTAQVGTVYETDNAVSFNQPQSTYSVCLNNINEDAMNSKREYDIRFRNFKVDQSKSSVTVNIPELAQAQVTGHKALDNSSTIALTTGKSFEIRMDAPLQEHSSSTLTTRVKHHGLTTAELKDFGESQNQVELVLHQPEYSHRQTHLSRDHLTQISGGSSTVIKEIGKHEVDRHYLTTNNENVNSTTMHVDIESKTSNPSFICTLSNKSVLEGERLVLQCQVSGTRSIEWLKDGSHPGSHCQLDFINNQIARLTISEVFEDDSGLYTCVAINGPNMNSCSAYISVLSESRFSNTQRTSYYISESDGFYTDQSYSRHTEMDSDASAIRFQSIPYSPPQTTTEDSTQVVVNPFEMFGARRNLKTNISTKVDRNDFILTKQLPNDLKKTENSFIKLEVATNEPSDSITWYKNNEAIESNNKDIKMTNDINVHSLIIPKLKYNSAGLYKIVLVRNGKSIESTCKVTIDEEYATVKENTNRRNKVSRFDQPIESSQTTSSTSPNKAIGRDLTIHTQKSPRPETHITVREASAENSVFAFSETEDGEFVAVPNNDE